MNKLNETILTLILTVYSLTVGFFAGRLIPAPQYTFSFKSALAVNKDAVWRTGINATVTLANCKPFQIKYPARFTAFIRMIAKHDIGLGYDALDKEDWAYTKVVNRTIWLTSSYFELSPAEQERTIAHEFLHMVGFPNHSSKTDFSSDQIYQLTDLCYPDLPKEAE